MKLISWVETNYYILEYELVANGKECGDWIQIKLSSPLEDPLACKRIAEKTVKSPACGEYFELQSTYKTCRCTPSGQECAMTHDSGATVYRIKEKSGKILVNEI